ncbi:RNA polymerase I-specific transcription initiation factor RRN3 [Quillaja saponaria]|uniref:RNA polymerase I-specific transcription initiation factor RRN3 n=1 Tax=Quillaja saponaria TaxID=32244 RepID=A0AAD7L9K8_QUISA|nr:RNA polymerase I-specific transcription initiation factor RRN3 [Quillaja saponaria]
MGREMENQKTDFHEMEDVNFSDSEIVSHVRHALTSVILGNSDSYDELVGVLHHKERLSADEVAMLVTSLKALTGAVSYIDFVQHEALVFAILRMSMWQYGADVMDALLELVTSLAASNGKFVDLCLDMLVRNFMPPHYFLEMLKQPHGLARKDQVLSRVHTALKDIADLVPLAPMRLSPIVMQRMPNVFSKEPEIVIYVENMLRLESGSMREAVGGTMLPALVDRMVELDVEIGWEDILLNDSTKGVFDMELEDDEDDDTELPAELLSWKCLQGNSVAEKLDSLMVLTFEHLESCQSSGRLDKAFEILLASFRRTVLNVYKSKFTQFVMFYACALDPEECGVKFAMMLLDAFVSDVNPPLTRMSAVAYLASYLSRGKFLSPSLIASLLKRLVDWCHEYCKMHNVDINPRGHQVFYSGCQAMMYVLCFHLRSLVDVPRLKMQILHMPIEPILKHRLNPLEVCLPTVVKEFLQQAKAAQLFSTSGAFHFNDLLESELSRAFGGMDRLDMFFPFDPCLLKKCDSFIRPYFIYWSMVKTAYDDDEEEGSSSDEDVADDHILNGYREDQIDDGMVRSFDELDYLDEVDSVLNRMSITPKNSMKYARMPSRIRPSTSPESL